MTPGASPFVGGVRVGRRIGASRIAVRWGRILDSYWRTGVRQGSVRARKRGQRSGCAGELRWRIRCMLTHGIALAPQAIRSLRMANDSVPVRTRPSQDQRFCTRAHLALRTGSLFVVLRALRFARRRFPWPCATTASHNLAFRSRARARLRKTSHSVAVRASRFARPTILHLCAPRASHDFTFRSRA